VARARWLVMVPPAVLIGNARFAAQVRDEGGVEVIRGQAFATIGEQEGHQFTRLVVKRPWLFGRPQAFPLVDACADQGVDCFGVGRHRLVDGNIEKAHRISWQHFPRFWDHYVLKLPPDAAHPQAHDLI